MSWTLELAARSEAQNRELSLVADSFPVLVGRDPTRSVLVLDGDPRVSKVHVKLDVREGRLHAFDTQSTNGTFARSVRLEPERWIDLGPATDALELQVGGWRVTIRGQELVAVARKRKGFEAAPSGVSRPRVTEAVPPSLLSSAVVVDALSHPAQVARAALDALEDALGRELDAVPPEERGEVARAIQQRLPETRQSAVLARYLQPESAKRTDPVPADGVAPHSAAEAASLEAIQAIARWYVDPHHVPNDAQAIAAFAGRLRTGVDALLTGLLDALSARDAAVRQMGLSFVETASSPSVFARALFEWRDPRTPFDGSLVSRAFATLSSHHAAYVRGVLSGGRTLLDELAPERVEATSGAALAPRHFWSPIFDWFTAPRAAVAAYRQRYRELTMDDDQCSAIVFGDQFIEEYRASALDSPFSAAVSSQFTLVPRPSVRGGTTPLAPAFPPTDDTGYRR